MSTWRSPPQLLPPRTYHKLIVQEHQVLRHLTQCSEMKECHCRRMQTQQRYPCCSAALTAARHQPGTRQIITASPPFEFSLCFFFFIFKLGSYTLVLSNMTNHFSFVVCMASNGILIICVTNPFKTCASIIFINFDFDFSIFQTPLIYS